MDFFFGRLGLERVFWLGVVEADLVWRVAFIVWRFSVLFFMPRTHGGEYTPLQPPEIRLVSVTFGDSLEAVR